MAWEASNGTATPKRFDIVVPDYTTLTDTYSIPWDYAIGSNVLNQLISVQPFISVYGEATHRGVNGNWAVMNCN